MTTKRLAVGITSVQSAKPNYQYGSSLQQVPLKANAATPLLNIAGLSSLPKNAVITSAKVWINQYDAMSGSNTWTLMRHLSAFTWQVTWNTRPAATTSASQTKSNPAAGTWWNIDITADAQAIVSGTRKNYGWRLATDSSTLHKIRSHRAAASQPYMEVVYTIPAKVPTNLAPQGGAVSIGDPVLTFTTGDDTVAIQVQVDPASDGVSPDFDSGEVAATAGVLDLADTAYAGLADAASTTWRARAKSASGWSAWSQWVTFERVDLEVAALTSPIATPADGTPPFEWTFSGTQTAWQADFLDSAGKVLDSSGLVAGADTAWTPARGLNATGSTGTARIRLHDDVTRIATPGAPIYAEDTVDITVTFDGTVDPLDTLVAAQTANIPAVNLTGTRADGVPDEVAIFRDGVQVARMAGTDVFTGTAFAWTDWTAPMNSSTVYRVAPIVDNAVASGGPTVTVTPSCAGLWIVNPETAVGAVLWDSDEGSWDATDVATVHRPVAEDAPVVRRRLRRVPLVGSLSGRAITVRDLDVDDTLDALDEFASDDAGTEYRIIAGHLNLRAIVGDILVTPVPYEKAETIAKVSLNFWGL